MARARLVESTVNGSLTLEWQLSGILGREASRPVGRSTGRDLPQFTCCARAKQTFAGEQRDVQRTRSAAGGGKRGRTPNRAPRDTNRACQLTRNEATSSPPRGAVLAHANFKADVRA